jgi:hypothetical protein
MAMSIQYGEAKVYDEGQLYTTSVDQTVLATKSANTQSYFNLHWHYGPSPLT